MDLAYGLQDSLNDKAVDLNIATKKKKKDPALQNKVMQDKSKIKVVFYDFIKT